MGDVAINDGKGTDSCIMWEIYYLSSVLKRYLNILEISLPFSLQGMKYDIYLPLYCHIIPLGNIIPSYVFSK